MKYRTAVPLGRGATGEVVKAWDPEVERHVALKFLKTDDPELARRMQREARLQARVSHPNVAEVYEVGRLGERPFIAMQLVEGRPLDEAAAALPLEGRIRLVATVARAIHAAHREGLVHRDLKPGNILVEEGDDGALVPYVLDFGIAREQQVHGETVTGQILGTPGYMSPEQARGESAGLDRRSDVFSLGVILYQLLTGSAPFEGGSAVETLVKILETEPVPPRRLAPELPRDLQTVVLTCLEKDPERRYASARALAEDLERFLDGEPVEARPLGIMGRLRRRARRHPVAAGLLATAAVAILVLGAALAVGLVKYTRDLARERNAAVVAREEAEEVASFLAGLFESASPYGEEADATARELLERGAERTEEELAGRPLLQARMQHVIGRVQRILGLFEESGEQLEAALATRREHLGEHHPDTARIHYEIGRLRKEEGDYQAAIEHHRRALAVIEESSGEDPTEVAKVLTALAAAAQESNADEPDAFALYERALAVYQQAGEPDVPGAAQVKNNMALILSSRRETERAEELFREALADFERAHGPDHLQVAQVLHNLGSLLGTRDVSTAISMLERALEIRTGAWGEQNPWVAYTTLNIGEMHSLRGDWAEAERWFRRARDVGERAGLPPDHLFFAVALYDVTQAAARRGRGQGAFEAYARARRHALEAAGNESAYSFWPLVGRAELALSRGRAEQAEEESRRALDVARDHLDPDGSQAAAARVALAQAFRAQGRFDEAEGILRELLAEPGGHAEAAGHGRPAARRTLVETLLDAGRLEEAAELLTEIDDPASDVVPDSDATPAERFEAARWTLLRARLAIARGEREQAGRWAEEARDLLAPVVAEHDDLPYHRAYVRALELLGEDDAAAPHRARLEQAGWRTPDAPEVAALRPDLG